MKFLTTKGIAASIEELIRDARQFIVLVSPYLKVDKTYIERLREADRVNVKIYLVFGKKDMSGDEKEKFQDFRHLEIHFLENLHAKCYMNESTAIITSMNLYGYSEEHNREMGIEICKNQDASLYRDIEKEAESILNSAKKCDVFRENSQKGFFGFNQKSKEEAFRRNYEPYTNGRGNGGFCIRCGERIYYDAYRPLCEDCYQTWAQFGNLEYPERYCHKCGREVWGGREPQVDYAHPLCCDCGR